MGGRVGRQRNERSVEKRSQLCHFFLEVEFLKACLNGLSCGLLISIASSNRFRAREMFELGPTRSNDGRLRGYLEDMIQHTRIMMEEQRSRGDGSEGPIPG
jgi:hypothetical protein